jgi:hypothetical protein
MAVTQGDYFDAIGRAGLVFSDGVLENITEERLGCTPCWDEAFSQFKQIEGAEFFYRNGDYAVSDDSALFYSYMLNIAGSQYSTATPDPNAQLPGNIIIIDGSAVATDLYYDQSYLIDAGGGNWYLPLVDSISGSVPTGAKPILVTLNGDSFTPTYSENFTPTRLYGFSDNTGPKTITVTVVTTI